MAIYRQKPITVQIIPQSICGSYPKNSLSQEFRISVLNMASYDLLLLMLKIENLDPRNKLRAIPRCPAGSFAVHIGDHLRFGIICGPIWGSSAAWGSFCGAVHQTNRSETGRSYQKLKAWRAKALRTPTFSSLAFRST